MTLVVAVTTPEGTWMGGERRVGAFDWNTLAHSKLFELSTEDGQPFAMGFAGEPRAVQVILSAHAPPRAGNSLHWWLTTYCDRLADRCAEQHVLLDSHDGRAAHVAGSTGAVLAIDGRVFLIDSELSWQETTRGYVAQGGAFETFAGAYEVLLDSYDPIEAARRAWPYVQRRHDIGPLVDEITLPAPANADT